MDKTVEQKVSELAMQVAEEHGFEIVGVDLLGRGRRMLLRVAIDKDGGVTLDDCEMFSRSLDTLLDVEDLIHGAYTLEVSSPGLDRPLNTLKDFEKSIGKLVRVITKEKVDNQNFFVGRIIEVAGNLIRLSTEKKEINIFFDNISKARLEIEIR